MNKVRTYTLKVLLCGCYTTFLMVKATAYSFAKLTAMKEYGLKAKQIIEVI